MKVGILLTTPPAHPNTATVERIVYWLREYGDDVEIFLMADGVYHLNDAALKRMLERGVRVSLCAQNATERGIPVPEPEQPASAAAQGAGGDADTGAAGAVAGAATDSPQAAESGAEQAAAPVLSDEDLGIEPGLGSISGPYGGRPQTVVEETPWEVPLDPEAAQAAEQGEAAGAAGGAQEQAPANIHYGSLYDLSKLVSQADKFLAFS